MESLRFSIIIIQDTVIISKLSQIKFEYLSSKLIYVNSGATRPRTPRCFQVLDYLVSSTRRLQFYVELWSDEKNDNGFGIAPLGDWSGCLCARGG